MILPIKYLPLTIELSFREGVNLGNFPTNTIRSFLASSVRTLVCTGKSSCGNCPLLKNCWFAKLFSPVAEKHYLAREGQSVPVPFLLVYPWEVREIPEGESLRFSLNIFLDDPGFLPILISAIRHYERVGIGKPKRRFKLQRITSGEFEVYNRRDDVIHVPNWRIIDENGDSSVKALRLKFLTPTSIKQKNRRIFPPGFADILKSIVRRYSLILFHHQRQLWELPGTLFEEAEKAKFTYNKYELHTMRRYSVRQKRIIPLNGFTGEMLVEGNISKYIIFFKIARYMGVGGKTSWGFGQIDYEIL